MTAAQPNFMFAPEIKYVQIIVWGRGLQGMLIGEQMSFLKGAQKWFKKGLSPNYSGDDIAKTQDFQTYRRRNGSAVTYAKSLQTVYSLC